MLHKCFCSNYRQKGIALGSLLSSHRSRNCEDERVNVEMFMSKSMIGRNIVDVAPGIGNPETLAQPKARI